VLLLVVVLLLLLLLLCCCTAAAAERWRDERLDRTHFEEEFLAMLVAVFLRC
jgi:hypothetical protein